MTMEMTFGKAHDVWSRVISGNITPDAGEVKAASQWFDEFCSKLSDKASQSEQHLQNSIQSREKDDAIERKRKAAESDKRQLEDFFRKYDDLIDWLNKQKRKD